MGIALGEAVRRPAASSLIVEIQVRTLNVEQNSIKFSYLLLSVHFCQLTAHGIAMLSNDLFLSLSVQPAVTCR